MEHVQTLRTKKMAADAIRRGHCWVYQDALQRHAALPSGSVVSLTDEQGRFLCRGVYDADSPIAVRSYTLHEAEPLDKVFRRKRLGQAFASRKMLLQDGKTTACRLCHGEGDFLPGLVIDLYKDVLVVQLDGAGAANYWMPTLVDDVRAAFHDLSIQAIYRKDRFVQQVLWQQSSIPHEIEVMEQGVRFAVNIVDGQKTGFFLDQRENRALIQRYARGKTVWNGFAYTGGFSVYAALGSATTTTSVDLSAQALDTAKRNFLLNHIAPSGHRFIAGDVFAHLRQLIATRITYDGVIVDPPSFASSESSLKKALGAYRDLFALAIQATASDGWTAFSSCSSHVTMEMFLECIRDALATQQRRGNIVELKSQPSDHPMLAGFPQGRYLKFALVDLKP